MLTFAFSTLASTPCPQGFYAVDDAVEKVLALSPFSCVNKLQNFEVSDATEFCSCQQNLPFKVSKRDFQTDDEKLKEIGDALLSEVFSIADLMSELNNELSDSDLQNVDLSKLSNCDLPSLLSNKNLSCSGKLDNMKLSTMFSSLGRNISPELNSVFGLDKSTSFSVLKLQDQVRKVIRVSTGDITLQGESKYCLPPKYQYMTKSLGKDASRVGFSDILFESEPDLIEKYNSSTISVIDKVQIANRALESLNIRCEKLKDNINHSVCSADLLSYRSAPGVNEVDNFIYNQVVDTTDSKKIEDLVGKFNAACESITQRDEVVKKSLRKNVYNNIIQRGEDLDDLRPADYLSSNMRTVNDFPQKMLNHCESICEDSSPYPKSGCKIKDPTILYEKYHCANENKSFDENLICAFVDVERSKIIEEEILNLAKTKNERELNEIMSNSNSHFKKESFAKLMRLDTAKKNRVSLLDKFLDGKPSHLKKEQGNVEVAKTNSDISIDLNKANKIVRREIVQNNDMAASNTALTNKLPSQKAISSSAFPSFSMSTGRTKINTIKKEENSLKSNNGNTGSTKHLESIDKLSSLMDRLDNAQKKASEKLSKVEAYNNVENSNRSRALANSSTSSVRGPHNSNSQSMNNRVGASQSGIVAAPNSPAIEYEKRVDAPTDLIGKGSNGIAASDERGADTLKSKINSLSSISRLFQGEFSNALVKPKVSDDVSLLKRVQVPDKIKMIDLAMLLKNTSEISPGEAFILYELVEGRRVEVTLVPTFTRLGRNDVFTGYRPLAVDSSNKFLVKKLTAHKNLFKEI